MKIQYRLLFLLSFCCVFHSMAQTTPYFVNSNNEVSDGTFESCTPNQCPDAPPDILCSNWESSSLADYNALVYAFGCILDDPNQININLLVRSIGVLYIDSKASNQSRYLRGFAAGLEASGIYKIEFHCRNIFDEIESIPNNVFGESGNQDIQILVSFGTQSILSPVISYDSTNPSFELESFVFTNSTNSIVDFSIELFDPINNTNIRTITALALDNVTIEKIGTEYPIVEDPVEDEVIVNQPCEDCTSFELTKNEKYVVSGWTKQTTSNYASIQTTSYQNSNIIIDFPGSVLDAFQFEPQGDIIDGWQKIEGVFVVPINATAMTIELNNDSSNIAFFDDIRIHPFNGNLKSFVYDQDTHRLMAELDENNYATYYEYDKEGGLVRVKKETSKGVFTIQETRSSTVKKE